VIAVLALLAVNLVDLHALSAATSGGFLLVYAIVNLANVKLARETGSQKWITGAGSHPLHRRSGDHGLPVRAGASDPVLPPMRCSPWSFWRWW
jgi:hypothetical protein